ncbi:ABC transporter ATP-binding protein [Sedimentibacter sp. zth1]|uniref:ABC transporter ATP-binding protein n=1 Tax=Sedimentibacter sp. zth1 TaxID=2816908 RepID=UPI001A931625|nr:ABC transporter ATP-binding protein [Sedimentibacter sp. zth1]QSX04816.1 ABC transporter ATP-binding protein [Sedimentibacter sp. zth1]
MGYALELKNVSKKYKNFELSNINIHLPKGCIMGFIGENGAGKTTTIKLILDLINRDAGSINVLGKDNKKDLDAVKENIGVVLDECFFPENVTAKNVNIIMKNIYTTWDEKKFYKYIKDFSLPLDKSIKDFSKGMKMKLSITVALSHDSKLLILDEATSGLDPIVKDEILEIFLQFIQDENHSIFISSHIISDLEKVCDYITLIHEGKIMFTEEKDELTNKYGLLKCSKEVFKNIDKSLVIGYRKNSFGVEALVYKNNLKCDGVIDKASIEDIMLFYVKEMSK